MIVTRTPHRISFLGGGTDLPSYFETYSGVCISMAINKYVYVCLKDHGSLFNENFRIVYSKTELVQKIESIENLIVKSCLMYFGLEKKKLYISSISDLPSGTGLGSSSSFTVGLLLALHKYTNQFYNLEQISDLACKIEIEIIGKSIGKQDQFSVALPGVKIINFKKNGSVNVTTSTILSSLFSSIINDISLIWSGNTRSADPILSEQNSNTLSGSIDSQLKIIHKNCLNFIDKINIESNHEMNILLLNKLITESWFEKRSITNNYFNKKLRYIDNVLFDLYKKENFGYKLCGAGGGGFFLAIGQKNKLKKIFPNRVSDIQIDKEGSVFLC